MRDGTIATADAIERLNSSGFLVDGLLAHIYAWHQGTDAKYAVSSSVNKRGVAIMAFSKLMFGCILSSCAPLYKIIFSVLL